VDAVIAVIPTIGLMLLFTLVLRSILRADRNERRALAVLERKAGERAPDSSSPVEPSGESPGEPSRESGTRAESPARDAE
jgi:hypothetical protein